MHMASDMIYLGVVNEEVSEIVPVIRIDVSAHHVSMGMT